MGKRADPKVLAAQPAVFIGLLIWLAVAVNYRFFLSPDYLPLHDTGDIFQVFTFAYSNFLLTGTLPEWPPPGDNAVDFDFTHPMRQAALWFIGLIGSCVLLIGCWAAGLGNRRRR